MEKRGHPVWRLTLISLIAALAAALLPLTAQGAFIDVYGSPAFTAGAGGFYGSSSHVTPTSNNYISSNGSAIGTVGKYGPADASKGARAVRWDSSSAPVELGNLGTDGNGVTRTVADGINIAGTVVGSARKYDAGVSKGDRAVRWDASGTSAFELGNFGTDPSGNANSYALGINASGDIAGYAEKYTSGVLKGPRAVRWTGSGASAVELGTLGTDSAGVTASYAHAVNDTGSAVGFAEKYVGGVNKGARAVRWDGTGTSATELGSLGTNTSGVAYAYAKAVNSTGTATGYADKYDGSGVFKGSRAVRWDGSGTAATELPTLGTSTSGGTSSSAYGVNSAGTVVGYVKKYDGSGVARGDRAVRWSAAGVLEELGTLGLNTSGSTFSYAEAINSAGFAVGYAHKYNLGSYAGDRAVYWDLSGTAVDLNNLIDPNSGWLLWEATGISDTGWITGKGTFDPDGPGSAEGYPRLFSMNVPATAVPEPSTGMVAVGVALTRTLRRRRDGSA